LVNVRNEAAEQAKKLEEQEAELWWYRALLASSSGHT
jgi:hypothetical protein